VNPLPKYQSAPSSISSNGCPIQPVQSFFSAGVWVNKGFGNITPQTIWIPKNGTAPFPLQVSSHSDEINFFRNQLFHTIFIAATLYLAII